MKSKLRARRIVNSAAHQLFSLALEEFVRAVLEQSAHSCRFRPRHTNCVPTSTVVSHASSCLKDRVRIAGNRDAHSTSSRMRSSTFDAVPAALCGHRIGTIQARRRQPSPCRREF